MAGAAFASRFSSFRAFRHKGYGALWTGAFVSNVGTWMETIAIGVFVTTTTGRAGWTGTIAALMYLPAIILSPIGGALADRIDRRRYLAVGTIAQILLAAALTTLALTDRLTIASIGVIAMLMGCTTALMSPAFVGLMSDLVPPEDMHSAFTLNSAQYNLGRILGPMIAAGIVGVSVAVAFGLNTASFIAVLIAIAVLPKLPATSGPHVEPLWQGIKAGFVASREDRGIWLSLVGTLAIAVLVSPFIGLVPVMAIKLLSGGPKETSLLVTCQGVGAVSCALLAGTLADWIGRRRLLEYAALGSAGLSALYWVSPTFGVAGMSLFLLGGAYLLTVTGLHTVCQVRAPKRLQARVSSMFTVLLGVGYAFGVLGQGWLGDLIGSRTVAATSSTLCALLILWARRKFPLHFDALEGTGEAMGHEAVRPVATLDGPTDQP